MVFKKYILLLGADQYLRERAISGVRQVTNIPIWTAAINAKINKNRYFDYNLEADPKNEKDLLNAINNQKLNGWFPEAIIPLNDWTLKVAHTLNDRLGLNYMPKSVIDSCRDKAKMKFKFLDNGVPTPDFRLIENEAELLISLEEIGYPAIIKPYDFGGSGGVYLLSNKQDAIENYRKSKNVIRKHGNDFGIDGSKFIVEKYIKSEEEISLEVACYKDNYKVIAVTEKYLTPEPRFAEIGHLVPSHRSSNKSLKEIAINACKSLNISMGLAHVEIKIKDNEFWVIEVGARPGGDGIMDIVERVFKINPYKVHAASYLNINPFEFLPTHLEPIGTAAIAFLKSEPGIISDIKIPDTLPKEVESLWVHAKIGDYSEEATCWKDREGVIELYWDKIFEYKTKDPLLISEFLSQQIFNVEKVIKNYV